MSIELTSSSHSTSLNIFQMSLWTQVVILNRVKNKVYSLGRVRLVIENLLPYEPQFLRHIHPWLSGLITVLVLHQNSDLEASQHDNGCVHHL